VKTVAADEQPPPPEITSSSEGDRLFFLDDFLLNVKFATAQAFPFRVRHFLECGLFPLCLLSTNKRLHSGPSVLVHLSLCVKGGHPTSPGPRLLSSRGFFFFLRVCFFGFPSVKSFSPYIVIPLSFLTQWGENFPL